MKNQTSINKGVLSMSLHELGLTPQSGGPLCVLIHENNETFEKRASLPRKCLRAPDICSSCKSKPHACRDILHQLPKVQAWRVLKKWKTYFEKLMCEHKRFDCSVSHFLMPALKNLLNALIQNGLPLEYVRAEIPAADRILQFESRRDFFAIA